MSIQGKSMGALLGVFVALSTILFVATNSADARYLPTRADETDMEVLKDIIKGLIVQSNLEQLEARMMSRQPQQTTRYYHQSGPQQQFQVERRSVEMPVGSDGDMLLSVGGSVGSLNNGQSIKANR